MPPLISISSSGPDFVSISQDFAWNIEEYLQCSKTFEWWVGEGPLFWYRIEWKNPICPPNECNSSISTCVIEAPNCSCTPPPPCPPGDCQTCDACEVWYVMATSVVDLCSRLNKECCNRSLFKKKVFRKVQKYDRPVLCCDVDKFIMSGISITDAYYDVDFCKCECVSWVDPCDCGKIVVPCDDDVPYRPCTPSTLSANILFGLSEVQVPTKPGFNINSIQIMKPQVDAIMTKCGMLPSNLKLKHNLTKTNVLKDFLSRNKLQLPEELNLVYSKVSDAWQKSVHLNGHNEIWSIVFSWSCADSEGGNFGWKLDTHVSKQFGTKKQNTRVVAGFASHRILGNGNMFDINFNYNTNTDKVIVKQPVIVKNKLMHDEIGLFKGSWTKDPYLTFNISVKG